MAAAADDQVRQRGCAGVVGRGRVLFAIEPGIHRGPDRHAAKDGFEGHLLEDYAGNLGFDARGIRWQCEHQDTRT